MAKIKAFKSIRPSKDFQEIIPALPYDVYSRAEARAYVEKHPHSFLAIDRPETQFLPDTNMYSPQVYAKAAQMIKDWLAEGSLIQDTKDCLYVYELTWKGHSQTGIVACASVDDYLNNVIRKHENTRAEKETDRINHVYGCKAQTGPIFLAHKPNEALKNIVGEVKQGKPLYDFMLNDVRNYVWQICNKEQIDKIEDLFMGIGSLYIADGHHRCASAVKVAQKMRDENPSYTGNEEFNWIMSVIFDASELQILDYNRVIKDLGNLTMQQFLDRLRQVFDFVGCAKSAIKPGNKGEMALYMNGIWNFLKVKEKFKSNDPVNGLDVAILQNQVLEPILGISDPTTDNRIDFVGGIRGLEELEKRVDDDCAAAFALYPTSMDELFAVADEEKLMPPKSTWFEPKLLSGIFLHDIDYKKS